MRLPQIVIDTNIWDAALKSRRGASHRLFSMVGTGKFEVNVSVPLILEYESVARRLLEEIPQTTSDIESLLDYICAVALKREVHYLWRPCLSDPKDDMVLEIAVASGSHAIITFNKSDFLESRQFGIHLFTPREYLDSIGELR